MYRRLSKGAEVSATQELGRNQGFSLLRELHLMFRIAETSAPLDNLRYIAAK